MKKPHHIIIAIILLLFCSCKKQNINSIDKLYILEYNYELHNEDVETPFFEFKVIGFTELDNQFNLKYARRLSWSSPYYYDSETIISGNRGSEIFKIMSNYQRDTTFLYKEKEDACRIYDGNAYEFIIQMDTIKETIQFEPAFLPDDLKFVYDFLYGNRQKSAHQSKYRKLFEMFEDSITRELPPPPLRSTIKFIAPEMEVD